MSLMLLCGCAKNHQTAEHAMERAQAYADAINHAYDTPEAIYAFLTEGTKAPISQEDFSRASAKARTYPSIPPLYPFSPEHDL